MWKLFLTTLIGLPLRSAQVAGKCDPEWTASNKPKCSVIYDTLERFLRFYKTKLFSQSLFYVCLIFFDQLLALLAVLCSDSRVCIPHCPKAHTVGQWHSIHPPLDWCEEGDKLGSCVNVAISFKSADPRNPHWLLYGIWPSIVSVTKYENLDFTLESAWSHWIARFFWGCPAEAKTHHRRLLATASILRPHRIQNRSIYWSTNDLHVLFISFIFFYIFLSIWILEYLLSKARSMRRCLKQLSNHGNRWRMIGSWMESTRPKLRSSGSWKAVVCSSHWRGVTLSTSKWSILSLLVKWTNVCCWYLRW